MASNTANAQFSFSELAKRYGGTGSTIEDIAEVMVAAAPILEDIVWKAANRPSSEYIVRRATLPTGTWRKANEGVAAEASTTQAVEEPIARLEARSEVDEALLDLVADKAAARRSEDIAFTEGMAQHLAKTLIWGTTLNATTAAPEEINGLQQRLGTIGTPATVIDNGGSTASTLTSIYVVDWSFNHTYCVYPVGADRGTLGLAANDKGRERVTDSSSNPYYAWVTQFVWWTGLAVRDEKATGRLANIDVTSTSGKEPFNEDKLIELLNLGHFNTRTSRIYMNQTVYTQAQIRLKDKTNVRFSLQEGLGGVPVMTFASVPIRMMENTIIQNTETQVT